MVKTLTYNKYNDLYTVKRKSVKIRKNIKKKKHRSQEKSIIIKKIFKLLFKSEPFIHSSNIYINEERADTYFIMRPQKYFNNMHDQCLTCMDKWNDNFVQVSHSIQRGSRKTEEHDSDISNENKTNSDPTNMNDIANRFIPHDDNLKKSLYSKSDVAETASEKRQSFRFNTIKKKNVFTKNYISKCKKQTDLVDEIVTKKVTKEKKKTLNNFKIESDKIIENIKKWMMKHTHLSKTIDKHNDRSNKGIPSLGIQKFSHKCINYFIEKKKRERRKKNMDEYTNIRKNLKNIENIEHLNYNNVNGAKNKTHKNEIQIQHKTVNEITPNISNGGYKNNHIVIEKNNINNTKMCFNKKAENNFIQLNEYDILYAHAMDEKQTLQEGDYIKNTHTSYHNNSRVGNIGMNVNLNNTQGSDMNEQINSYKKRKIDIHNYKNVLINKSINGENILSHYFSLCQIDNPENTIPHSNYSMSNNINNPPHPIGFNQRIILRDDLNCINMAITKNSEYTNDVHMPEKHTYKFCVTKMCNCDNHKVKENLVNQLNTLKNNICKKYNYYKHKEKIKKQEPRKNIIFIHGSKDTQNVDIKHGINNANSLPKLNIHEEKKKLKSNEDRKEIKNATNSTKEFSKYISPKKKIKNSSLIFVTPTATCTTSDGVTTYHTRHNSSVSKEKDNKGFFTTYNNLNNVKSSNKLNNLQNYHDISLKRANSRKHVIDNKSMHVKSKEFKKRESENQNIPSIDKKKKRSLKKICISKLINSQLSDATNETCTHKHIKDKKKLLLDKEERKKKLPTKPTNGINHLGGTPESNLIARHNSNASLKNEKNFCSSTNIEKLEIMNGSNKLLKRNKESDSNKTTKSDQMKKNKHMDNNCKTVSFIKKDVKTKKTKKNNKIKADTIITTTNALTSELYEIKKLKLDKSKNPQNILNKAIEINIRRSTKDVCGSNFIATDICNHLNANLEIKEGTLKGDIYDNAKADQSFLDKHSKCNSIKTEYASSVSSPVYNVSGDYNDLDEKRKETCFPNSTNVKSQESMLYELINKNGNKSIIKQFIEQSELQENPYTNPYNQFSAHGISKIEEINNITNKKTFEVSASMEKYYDKIEIKHIQGKSDKNNPKSKKGNLMKNHEEVLYELLNRDDNKRKIKKFIENSKQYEKDEKNENNNLPTRKYTTNESQQNGMITKNLTNKFTHGNNTPKEEDSIHKKKLQVTISPKKYSNVDEKIKRISISSQEQIKSHESLLHELLNKNDNRIKIRNFINQSNERENRINQKKDENKNCPSKIPSKIDYAKKRNDKIVTCNVIVTPPLLNYNLYNDNTHVAKNATPKWKNVCVRKKITNQNIQKYRIPNKILNRYEPQNKIDTRTKKQNEEKMILKKGITLNHKPEIKNKFMINKKAEKTINTVKKSNVQHHVSTKSTFRRSINKMKETHKGKVITPKGEENNDKFIHTKLHNSTTINEISKYSKYINNKSVSIKDKNGCKNEDKNGCKNEDKNGCKNEDKNGCKNEDKNGCKNDDKNDDKSDDKNEEKNDDKSDDKSDDKQNILFKTLTAKIELQHKQNTRVHVVYHPSKVKNFSQLQKCYSYKTQNKKKSTNGLNTIKRFNNKEIVTGQTKGKSNKIILSKLCRRKEATEKWHLRDIKQASQNEDIEKDILRPKIFNNLGVVIKKRKILINLKTNIRTKVRKILSKMTSKKSSSEMIDINMVSKFQQNNQNNGKRIYQNASNKDDYKVNPPHLAITTSKNIPSLVTNSFRKMHCKRVYMIPQKKINTRIIEPKDEIKFGAVFGKIVNQNFKVIKGKSTETRFTYNCKQFFTPSVGVHLFSTVKNIINNILTSPLCNKFIQFNEIKKRKIIKKHKNITQNGRNFDLLSAEYVIVSATRTRTMIVLYFHLTKETNNVKEMDNTIQHLESCQWNVKKINTLKMCAQTNQINKLEQVKLMREMKHQLVDADNTKKENYKENIILHHQVSEEHVKVQNNNCTMSRIKSKKFNTNNMEKKNMNFNRMVIITVLHKKFKVKNIFMLKKKEKKTKSKVLTKWSHYLSTEESRKLLIIILRNTKKLHFTVDVKNTAIIRNICKIEHFKNEKKTLLEGTQKKKTLTICNALNDTMATLHIYMKSSKKVNVKKVINNVCRKRIKKKSKKKKYIKMNKTIPMSQMETDKRATNQRIFPTNDEGKNQMEKKNIALWNLEDLKNNILTIKNVVRENLGEEKNTLMVEDLKEGIRQTKSGIPIKLPNQVDNKIEKQKAQQVNSDIEKEILTIKKLIKEILAEMKNGVVKEMKIKKSKKMKKEKTKHKEVNTNLRINDFNKRESKQKKKKYTLNRKENEEIIVTTDIFKNESHNLDVNVLKNMEMKQCIEQIQSKECMEILDQDITILSGLSVENDVMMVKELINKNDTISVEDAYSLNDAMIAVSNRNEVTTLTDTHVFDTVLMVIDVNRQNTSLLVDDITIPKDSMLLMEVKNQNNAMVLSEARTPNDNVFLDVVYSINDVKEVEDPGNQNVSQMVKHMERENKEIEIEDSVDELMSKLHGYESAEELIEESTKDETIIRDIKKEEIRKEIKKLIEMVKELKREYMKEMQKESVQNNTKKENLMITNLENDNYKENNEAQIMALQIINERTLDENSKKGNYIFQYEKEYEIGIIKDSQGEEKFYKPDMNKIITKSPEQVTIEDSIKNYSNLNHSSNETVTTYYSSPKCRKKKKKIKGINIKLMNRENSKMGNLNQVKMKERNKKKKKNLKDIIKDILNEEYLKRILRHKDEKQILHEDVKNKISLDLIGEKEYTNVEGCEIIYIKSLGCADGNMCSGNTSSDEIATIVGSVPSTDEKIPRTENFLGAEKSISTENFLGAEKRMTCVQKPKRDKKHMCSDGECLINGKKNTNEEKQNKNPYTKIEADEKLKKLMSRKRVTLNENLAITRAFFNAQKKDKNEKESDDFFCSCS
ncbi:hypothetical protein PGO_050210 [Plasmodium gonderi]|uniref:Uncharacterized protein n=1 Tax=Plasmodium gonderi TaxID=77519 RepID=A0A1Y1JAQ6_PLAGO|nr:hypothetical protein PGO_050210 [Plasmodium gonderi]GAW79611.1 hypothetical protein PGO_050210 [Plasmodium gonderi]